MSLSSRIVKFLFAASCLLWLGAARAEQCTVERASGANFQVDIDGKKYLAITRETADKAKECNSNLASSEEKFRIANDLVTKAEKLQAELQTSIAQRDAHIKTLNDQIADLKLAKKKLEDLLSRNGPIFEGGIGLNNDVKGVALVGAGYRQWHVWGYAEQRDKIVPSIWGLMLGREF
ncbi:MAG: hypothetical protein OEW08_09520 [Gammaproteobacteria bacterium]|nr:hypothetical protein [Gammaproteobacteria bacterium]